MRNTIVTILAGMAAAAPLPALAQTARHAPEVRVHRLSQAGTSWGSHRDAGPGYDSRGFNRYEDDDRHGYDEGGYAPALPYYYDPSTEEDFRHERADQRYPERMVRDEAGEIDYDRDYPYDYRYGRRGYVMTETIVTTTTPTVTRRIYHDAPIVMHAPVRHRRLRRIK